MIYDMSITEHRYFYYDRISDTREAVMQKNVKLCKKATATPAVNRGKKKAICQIERKRIVEIKNLLSSSYLWPFAHHHDRTHPKRL